MGLRFKVKISFNFLYKSFGNSEKCCIFEVQLKARIMLHIKNSALVFVDKEGREFHGITNSEGREKLLDELSHELNTDITFIYLTEEIQGELIEYELVVAIGDDISTVCFKRLNCLENRYFKSLALQQGLRLI